jgi:putative FmdB family regulatory protein
MPTYQYACTNPECGNEFERFQAFTDAALTECPVCSERIRKVYGSVGVVFKGSGFYRTDSRDSKSATAPAASGADSAGSSSTSGTPSDSSSKASTGSKTPEPASASSAAGGSSATSGSAPSRAAAAR